MTVIAPRTQGKKRLVAPKAVSRLSVEDVVTAFGGTAAHRTPRRTDPQVVESASREIDARTFVSCSLALKMDA